MMDRSKVSFTPLSLLLHANLVGLDLFILEKIFFLSHSAALYL